MRPPLRRLVAAGSLIGYVLLLGGVPLPAPVEKDRSQPFPCQHHRCGCTSAEQCWKRCCCFSHQQKMAWARAQGVTPPAKWLAASLRDERSHSDHSSPDHSNSTATCCSSKHKQPSAQSSCCQSHSRSCCKAQPAAEPKPAIQMVDVIQRVDIARAQRCAGEASLWANATVAVPVPVTNSFDVRGARVEWRRLSNVTSFSGPLPLDPPPPKA